MTKKKNKGGRPPIELTPEQISMIEMGGKIGATQEETAAAVGISVDTLNRRFADVYKKGCNQRNFSIRHAQVKLALSGNATMLIWLGKQLLGQVEGGMPDDVVEKLKESLREAPMAEDEWMKEYGVTEAEDPPDELPEHPTVQ